MHVQEVLPRDAIPSIDDPTFDAAYFGNPGDEFELHDGTLRADGTTWDPVTGESADGRSLDRVPARRLFAFSWQDAHNSGSFYEP